MTTHTRFDIDTQLDRAAERMWQERNRLVALQIEALMEFEGYSEISKNELEQSCERNVARVTSMLRNENELPSSIRQDERTSGARRAIQGIPPEVVVAAYRAVIGVIRDDFLDQAADLGVSVEAMLTGIRRLWILTDHFSSTLVAARHEVELEVARKDEQQRAAFVRLALDADAPWQQVVDAGERLGIDCQKSFWLFRGVIRSNMHEARLAFANPARATSPLPVLITTETTIDGVVEQRPKVPASVDATIAVYGPVQVSEFAVAAHETNRILGAATKFRTTGVVDLEMLGLKMIVAENTEQSELLLDRYIDPVFRNSKIATEILYTVECFLDANMSINETAEKLFIHENTVRYRLQQFENITKCSLSRTEQIVEVWWALKANLER